MITCFPPIIDYNCEAIVLGSMPGVKSLEKGEYYAHKQNSFWDIMEKHFKVYSDFTYRQKVKLLLNNKIALWDVIHSCKRKGSFESSIEDDSIIVNDFPDILLENPNIKYIFCNGTAAYTAFNKYVLKELDHFLDIEVFKLPSSSPANTRITKEQKVKAWGIIKEKLQEK